MYTDPSLSVVLTVSNMGNYFYTSPLVTYDFSGGVTGTYSETNLSNVTNYSQSDVSLNETIDISNSQITGTFSQTYNTSIILNDISLNNIVDSINFVPASSINTIVDYPSYELVNNIQTIQTLSSSSGALPGYRVWSAPSSNTMDPSGIVPYLYISSGSDIPNGTANVSMGYSDISYNNSWDISNLTSIYGVSSELLIANGYFTTNHDYYLDYSGNYSGGIQNAVNYLPSNMGTEYRYATFVWDISNNNYNNVTVSIDFSNTTLYTNTNGYIYFDENLTQALGLYYRLGDNYVDSFGTYNSTTYYPNTLWISMNSNPNIQINATNAYQDSSSVYYASPTSISNITNGYLSVNTAFPQSMATITGDTIYLYVRIGIPDLINGFNNVTAQLFLSSS